MTTRCSQLKMTAVDGKQYATDCFAQDDIIQLVRVIPSKKTSDFLDWFVYSDNTIDGQSKKKAYTLLESGLLDDMKPGTVKSLQQIHAFLFGGLYDFAGKIRTKTISKGNTIFCLAEHLHRWGRECVASAAGGLISRARAPLDGGAGPAWRRPAPAPVQERLCAAGPPRHGDGVSLHLARREAGTAGAQPGAETLHPARGQRLQGILQTRRCPLRRLCGRPGAHTQPLGL